MLPRRERPLGRNPSPPPRGGQPPPFPSGGNFRKVRETPMLELGSEALGLHPDRCLGPGCEREDRPASRPQHAGDLVQERDHVLVRRRGRTTRRGRANWRRRPPRTRPPERACAPLRASPSRRRPRRPRGGKPLSDRSRSGAGSGADVQRPLDRAGNSLERGLVGRERVGKPHRVPDWREVVELPPDQRTEERPEARPAHHGVRRQPGEPAADRYSGSTRSLTSIPARTPNVWAALPREIASAMFWYASS